MTEFIIMDKHPSKRFDAKYILLMAEARMVCKRDSNTGLLS